MLYVLLTVSLMVSICVESTNKILLIILARKPQSSFHTTQCIFPLPLFLVVLLPLSILLLNPFIDLILPNLLLLSLWHANYTVLELFLPILFPLRLPPQLLLCSLLSTITALKEALEIRRLLRHWLRFLRILFSYRRIIRVAGCWFVCSLICRLTSWIHGIVVPGFGDGRTSTLRFLY